MSAPKVAKAAADAIRSNKYAVVIVNFANPDMVGHTGNEDAAIKACEAVDKGVKEIAEAVDAVNGAMLVTADHGNSDQMYEPAAKTAHTRHTLNPVEVVLYGDGMKGLKLRKGGCLGDVAPTLLEMLGFKKPEEMTGCSLIEK